MSPSSGVLLVSRVLVMVALGLLVIVVVCSVGVVILLVDTLSPVVSSVADVGSSVVDDDVVGFVVGSIDVVGDAELGIVCVAVVCIVKVVRGTLIVAVVVGNGELVLALLVVSVTVEELGSAVVVDDDSELEVVGSIVACVVVSRLEVVDAEVDVGGDVGAVIYRIKFNVLNVGLIVS